MSEKQKESIRFVTRHYSAGAFKAGRGRWHEYIPAEPWWRRRGIAAAAGCVVLAAAASAGLYFGLSPSKQVPETTSPPPGGATAGLCMRQHGEEHRDLVP